MKLSRSERWILSNQYRILEKLQADETEVAYFRRCREVIDSGYEIEYGWIADYIVDEEQCLTREDCKEVLEILDMHRDLKYSYGELADKTGIDEADIFFGGFDGNSEVKMLGYLHHLRKEGKYDMLDPGQDDFNSHISMLGAYRGMLVVWKALRERRGVRRDSLTHEELLAVIAAKPHPNSPQGRLARTEPQGPVQ